MAFRIFQVLFTTAIAVLLILGAISFLKDGGKKRSEAPPSASIEPMGAGAALRAPMHLIAIDS
jgi:hypothetical protein